MRIDIPALTTKPIHSRTLRLILILVLVLVLLTTGTRFALGSNALGVDFFTFWRADKALFLEQQSPYSDAVVQDTQLGLYNRLALPGEDQVAFVYPLFMLFLVFPFTFFDFPTAQALWLSIHLVFLTSVTFLAFSSKGLWPALSATFFYPLSLSLILGNFNLTSGLIFYCFFGAFFRNLLHKLSVQAILGVGLAFAAGKPLFVYLMLLIACLTLLKNRLWRGLVWFVGTLLGLLGLSFLLLPAWLPEWISRVRTYITYPSNDSVFNAVFGFIENRQILTTLSIIFLIRMIGWLGISILRWLRIPPANKRPVNRETTGTSPANQHMIFMIALAGLSTYAFHPFGKSYEQIIIHVPFLLWAVILLPDRPAAVKNFGVDRVGSQLDCILPRPLWRLPASLIHTTGLVFLRLAGLYAV